MVHEMYLSFFPRHVCFHLDCAQLKTAAMSLCQQVALQRPPINPSGIQWVH